MTGQGGDVRDSGSGRPWLIAGLVLAVAATAALVFSQDIRWLRLGIVAALWAALLGAFLAARYRKQADHAQDEASQAQTIYELELEREIAARREYELEVEAEIRRDIEAESRGDLDALRDELSALRANLERLFGGELLYERVALTAQSTRMRSSQYDQTYLPPGSEEDDRSAALLGRPAPLDGLSEQRTELIAKVLEVGLSSGPPPMRRLARSEPAAPAAKSSRWDDDLSGGRRAESNGGARPAAKPASNGARQPARPASNGASQPARPASNGAEPAKGAPRHVEAPPEPVKFRAPIVDGEPAAADRDLSSEFAREFDLDWQTSWQGAKRTRDAAKSQEPRPADNPPPPGPSPVWDAFQSDLADPQPQDGESQNSTLPEQVLQIQQENRPSGRRRKPEPDDADQHAPRAVRGRHAPPEPEPEPEEPPSTGAHGAGDGRSVADLLAAYGAGDTPRRHRRRD